MDIARFWLLPLFAAPGIWLAWRLYLRGARAPRRTLLACLYALAWILIGLLAVSPLWRSKSETWHAPRVVLAVDQGESYAATGARDAATRAVRAARRHYESLGFRVIEEGLGAKGLAGLRRARHPNLQAVIVWTDGRFQEADADDGPWPAPVHPAIVTVSGGEVQGERAEADFTAAGAEFSVEWRAVGGEAGRAPDAELILADKEKILWKVVLPHPAGVSPGERVAARLPLPPAVAAADPAGWIVLVRPAKPGANATRANDTVALAVRGKNRPLRIFVRPLATLAERGLLDALRDPDPSAVVAVAAASLDPAARDVVWIHARSAALAQARTLAGEAKAPVIAYHLPVTGGADGARDGAFGPDARLAWHPDGARFLPAGALRLADIGAVDAQSPLRLRAPDPSVEALAWAEEGGRRGLLFWRDRGAGGVRSFGFAAPPLWRASFAPGARGGEANMPARWVQGASEWARAFATEPAAAPAGRAKVPPARNGGRLRLGNDLEALARLAARGNGSVINTSNNNFDKYSWPALPGGQTRATSSRALPLAPPLFTALAIAALLCAVWALRRRLLLD